MTTLTGADNLRYRDFNLNARFLPQDARDTTTRPCLEVGGVQIYAYFDEHTGQLVISADYDTADPAVFDSNDCVPTRFTVSGYSVWQG